MCVCVCVVSELLGDLWSCVQQLCQMGGETEQFVSYQLAVTNSAIGSTRISVFLGMSIKNNSRVRDERRVSAGLRVSSMMSALRVDDRLTHQERNSHI